ncbi:hypothetical protein TIFTF001_046107, partial [Ficus carica]
MEHFFKYLNLGKIINSQPQNIGFRVILLVPSIVLLSVASLHLLSSYSSSSPWLMSYINSISFGKKCDIFRGEWVYDPNRLPFYTNFTCPEIFDQQNCMKFGRPDSDFLKWRWKPAGCELPPFDALRFLELVNGKSMAFVGDSVARNQMQSLLCLLATVEYPADVSQTTSARFKRWLYTTHNFTLASFWSPYLIKSTETTKPNGTTKSLTNLYLDEAHTNWTSQIEAFDFVIISAGRWFFGPKMFYEKGHVVGCHFCMRKDTKNLTMFYGYKRAFRTAFEALLGLESFKGEVILRTLSPAHFENGEWNKGGECKRTEPVSRAEMKVNWGDWEMYKSQIEVVRGVEREGKKRGLKIRVLDVTEAMAVRPDGHPNHFGHWP